ncbi:unnamed protein product [Schistosoma margrebowiei]|uniref:Uncharacterized protein n=1 Tax=Schistosoma margrebowiei TaxID=48269 RepID=A0A183M4Q8_9TREM|nr:unnamed protein product [Schistosoma margrebowiei]
MQNDMKLPINERRNYKNCIDGLIHVVRHEGVIKLFNGVSMTASRAAFMTLGQLAFYDKFKILLINSGGFEDKPLTHMIASSSAECTPFISSNLEPSKFFKCSGFKK